MYCPIEKTLLVQQTEVPGCVGQQVSVHGVMMMDTYYVVRTTTKGQEQARHGGTFDSFC